MRLCHNPLFVIASDRRERGNPTRKVVARAKPVAISRVPSPPQANRDKASVAALPRNDIMTQPQSWGFTCVKLYIRRMDNVKTIKKGEGFPSPFLFWTKATMSPFFLRQLGWLAPDITCYGTADNLCL